MAINIPSNHSATNISQWIESHARFAGSRVAVETPTKSATYSQLLAETEQMAARLRDPLGIESGDRIAYLGYNSIAMLNLLFAAARLGAIVIPLNWRLAAPEIDYILTDAKPKVLISEPSFQPMLNALKPAHPDCTWLSGGDEPPPSACWPDFNALDPQTRSSALPLTDPLALPVLIVYTSGTTGRPKGAVLSQRALLFNALNSVHMHEMRVDDAVLSVLPMFHVGGLNIQTLPALYVGAKVFLHPRFDPGTTLKSISVDRPTLCVLVPATLRALREHPDWARSDLASLRSITTGSSNVPSQVIEPFHNRQVPIIQVYGSTETAPIAIYQRSDWSTSKVGSTGMPGLHCEAKLIDEIGREIHDQRSGEILVRGPNLMDGYWQNPEASAEALQGGWYHSGDIGHRDKDGHYWIDDRKKDVIVSGGENIYPAEIEQLLQQLPGIAEAVVVAQPDERWGEVPVAVIEPKPNLALDTAAILKIFDGRLARYKHPRAAIIMPELPRNAMGKVQKFRVLERLRDTQP